MPACSFQAICDTFNSQLFQLQGLYVQLAETTAAIDRFKGQIRGATSELSDQDPSTLSLLSLLDSLYRCGLPLSVPAISLSVCIRLV